MSASEAAVKAVMKETGCVSIACWCGELDDCDGVRRCDVHRTPWPAEAPYCPAAESMAANIVKALGLTVETKTHARTGPGKCSCGFDAYRNAGIMADYTSLTQAHFRAVERGKVPTGTRLVGPWSEASS